VRLRRNALPFACRGIVAPTTTTGNEIGEVVLVVCGCGINTSLSFIVFVTSFTAAGDLVGYEYIDCSGFDGVVIVVVVVV